MCEVIHRRTPVCTAEDEQNRNWLRRVSGTRPEIRHHDLSIRLLSASVVLCHNGRRSFGIRPFRIPLPRTHPAGRLQSSCHMQPSTRSAVCRVGKGGPDGSIDPRHEVRRAHEQRRGGHGGSYAASTVTPRPPLPTLRCRMLGVATNNFHGSAGPEPTQST